MDRHAKALVFSPKDPRGENNNNNTNNTINFLSHITYINIFIKLFIHPLFICMDFPGHAGHR